MISACQTKDTSVIDSIPEGFHKVVVGKVLHTTKYTYLLAKEGETENWLAIPKMETAKIGETYFYSGGFDMIDFKSKELSRTFEKVVFLSGVSKKPVPMEKDSPQMGSSQANAQGTADLSVNPHTTQPNGKITTKKVDLDLSAEEDCITIAELFKNKDKYNGQTIKIKGKAVKFSEAIMNTNWIHIQDGTDYEGKFDLTVTSDESVIVGNVIIVEGVLAINKDFGYGYYYDVIIEKAKLIK